MGRVVVLHPGVRPELLGGGSIVGAVLHAALDEGSGSGGHVVGHSQVSGGDLGVEVLVVLAAERKLAAEEREEEHPRGVNVRRWTAELGFLDYFGSHI